MTSTPRRSAHRGGCRAARCRSHRNGRRRAATYEHPLNASLKWRLNVGTKYLSEYNTGSDLNPLKMQDAYALVDARIGIGSQSDSWAVELWGKNVTNEDYVQVVDAPLQSGSLGAFLGDPRFYGATFRLNSSRGERPCTARLWGLATRPCRS